MDATLGFIATIRCAWIAIITPKRSLSHTGAILAYIIRETGVAVVAFVAIECCYTSLFDVAGLVRTRVSIITDEGFDAAHTEPQLARITYGACITVVTWTLLSRVVASSLRFAEV